MDEAAGRNSSKLDIEAAASSIATAAASSTGSAGGDSNKFPKESYKKLSEAELDLKEQHGSTLAETSNRKADTENGANKDNAARGIDNVDDDDDDVAMVRENGTTCKEGEDEKMLNGAGDEKDKLTQKELEVKFISESNGDARIDLELENSQPATFSGMTKEELMKYANDPFWVRLRWFLFVLFWALWIAMLAGAIYIIMAAPKCAAPVPLTWWQEGPHVRLAALTAADGNEPAHFDETVGGMVKGAIYELPADETYLVQSDPTIAERIRKLVAKVSPAKLILDVTANFVTKNDALFREALNGAADSSARAAFVFKTASGSAPTNWLAVSGGGESAWRTGLAEGKQDLYVLGQFGPERFDLQLAHPLAKEKLKSTLRHLVGLGVAGFRLANAKHFIIDAAGKNDENAALEPSMLNLKDYDFWTHEHTTYQNGLGALLAELALDVHNATKGEGFLSVTEDIRRPEVFAVDSKLSVDLPIFGNVESKLSSPAQLGSAVALNKTISQAYDLLKPYRPLSGEDAASPWIQWSYSFAAAESNGISPSAHNIFMFLLPGVPVFPLDEHLLAENGTLEVISQLSKYRASPSFQHGSFVLGIDHNETAVGYARQKSGNPGYFVALNLAGNEVRADFSKLKGIAEELTIVLTSINYNMPGVGVKSKISSNEVPMSGMSALVATYVPKQG